MIFGADSYENASLRLFRKGFATEKDWSFLAGLSD